MISYRTINRHGNQGMTKQNFNSPGTWSRLVTAIRICTRGAIGIAAMLTLAAGAVGATEPAGKADYQHYCADCHGKDAKGNGPFMTQVPMTPPPSDLTLLASEHGGKFPFDEVVNAIDGRKTIPSHGRIQMPFWGVTLQKPGEEFTPPSDAEVKRRIDAMAKYIESLQR